MKNILIIEDDQIVAHRDYEEALKKIDGPVTGAKIRDALEGLCDIDNPYVDGRFCYSATDHEGFGGDALRPVVVKDGAFRSIFKK